jgi:hypothetical protein
LNKAEIVVLIRPHMPSSSTDVQCVNKVNNLEACHGDDFGKLAPQRGEGRRESGQGRNLRATGMGVGASWNGRRRQGSWPP